MGFTVVQECPQCGGPVELDETDRLLRCPYCGVKSFLFSHDCCRFVLPSKGHIQAPIYVPYLRFKGSVFTCGPETIHHRILDITQLGVPFKRFPISLGLRPQTMKMRFARMAVPGSFLKCFLKRGDILARVERGSASAVPGDVCHRAFIGDAISLIYLPLYVQHGTLVDGITDRPVATLPEAEDVFSPVTEHHPEWKPAFLATLCPRCGWDLAGERDSVVLTCRNCETAWEAKSGGFSQVDVGAVPTNHRKPAYLPFWKMAVRTTGLSIASYADFIRATNQPRVIQKAWEDQGMVFWSPAFKIRPNRFLHLSRRLTVAQEGLMSDQRLPRTHLHPVTLPLSEAIQGIKLTLAGSAVNMRTFMPNLPGMGIVLKGASLVYLPFCETAHDMVQEQTSACISKNTLAWGRFL